MSGDWRTLAEVDALEAALTGEASIRHRAGMRELDEWLGTGPPAPVMGAAARARPAAPLPYPGSRVTVVIPVHNALAELRGCFDALVRTTAVPARLLFVDDASFDPAVAHALMGWERFASVAWLANAVNQGFSATVNRGLRASPGEDVVILNSDTVVTPGWLPRLITTAYSDPRIATVTPVSGNAGAFSVPAIGEANAPPPFLDADSHGRLIAQGSLMLRPEAPTANGFCMYVKRGMLDDVGLLDADAFPMGYGEENDLCMRALAAGWRHVVDDRVLVHHVREASFGPRRTALMTQGRARVDERHPQYTGRVQEFVEGEMTRVRSAVAATYRHGRERYAQPAARREVRPRVLFCLHEGRGGVPMTTRDLMQGLEDEYDCWLLGSTGSELVLARMVDGERHEVDRFALDGHLSLLDLSRLDYRRIVADVLDRHAIELVHVRHLFKHTLDLPGLAAARAIPVILSVHDYYLVCPTVHLLDEHGHYCAGECTSGAGDCTVPMDTWPADAPPLKHSFVHQWRAEVELALAGVDAVITTSPQALDVHRRALPELARRPCEVIEHGRDLTGAAAAVAPVPGGEVRIAVPGNLDPHKGAELMRAMLACDPSGRIRFEMLGDVAAEYADLGRIHGPYERDQLAGRLGDLRPAFVGVLATWAETYSHVLSEAWAAGIPVLATDLGAPAERIRRHGGGWLLNPGDPRGAVESILAIADDPQGYAAGRAQATVANVRDVAAMSADYSAVYRRVIDARRVVVPRAPRPGARHLGHGVLRAEVIAPGQRGDFPGSTHVRLLRRLHHPSFRPKLQATVHHGRELTGLAPGRDLVIVQRTALPPERVDWFLGEVRERSLPLVLDLDDDLWALGDEHPEYGPQLAGLERLLAAAALVTVSTPALQAEIARRGAPTLVVDNALDERLFFANESLPTPPARGPGEPLRAVYVSGPGHEHDLELLAPVFERLAADRVPVVLDVVSRPLDGDPPAWYRSLPVAPGHGGYPTFVDWLRRRRPSWDLALAPLCDTPLNHARSDLKFLEYSALGLPGIYSRSAAYASVTPEVTGMVVDNDPDAWCEAIVELASDPARRARMAESALVEVTGRRLLAHGADRLLAALFDLVADGG